MKITACLKRALALGICALTLSLAACSGGNVLSKKEDLLSSVKTSSAVTVYDFNSQETTTPENYDSYCEDVTEFSLSLLSAVYDGQNTLIPTLSQHQTLALLLNGVSGKTASELKKAISPSADVQTLNTGNYYLQSRTAFFNTEEMGYFAESGLWFDDLFDIKSAFTQSAKNYYPVTLARLELNTEDGWKKINKNTNLRTQNCFEQILDAPLKDQVIFGESVATIKDTWAVPYTSDRVKEGTFNGANGKAQVNFLTSNERYFKTDLGEGFVKSLENTPVKFAVIVPNEADTVDELLNTLTYNRLRTMLIEGSATDFCTVSFPEFTQSVNYSPDSFLRTLGISDIFSSDANFSSLTNGTGAKLSSTLTASHLEVTAEGIGADTELESQGDTLKEMEKKLTVDRPFVYIFFDNESGVPLFMGVVMNI